MRAMMDVGARHFYISNLPLHRRRLDAERDPRSDRREGMAQGGALARIGCAHRQKKIGA